MTRPEPLAAWLEMIAGSPLEFNIQYPPRPEYFQQHFQVASCDGAFRDPPPQLLYVHVPFCSARCGFCIFGTEPEPPGGRLADYVDGLLAELRQHPELARGVSCLDLGGGTPTLLPERDLGRLLAVISPLVRSSDPLARSIETTPEAATPGRLALLRTHGFGRVSVGVQSFADTALALAGRLQPRSAVSRAVEAIGAAGFQRVNLDLIFGLPGQTAEAWREDLLAAAALGPDSITTYDCLHRGAGRQRSRAGGHLPTPMQMGALYDLAFATLTERGYLANYGSLNFSRHPGETGTSSYFERRVLFGEPYLGIGANASALSGGAWRFNFQDVDDYLRAVGEERSPAEWSYRIPLAEQQAKHLLLALNFGRIGLARFRELFGQDLSAAYPDEVALALRRGWLVADQGALSLAPGQFANLYTVRGLFYSMPARRWLREWTR